MVKVNPFRSRPLTKRKCVGVVGLLQAGKTVFITSLVDHLKNHDPSRLPIGRNGTEVTAIPGMLRPATRWNDFDFDLYKDQLAIHEWPLKTLQSQEFRSLFFRDDWPRTLIDLSLLDVPGERMADMAIAACPKFGDWSDVTVKMLRTHSEFREAAQPFLQFIDGPAADEFDADQLLIAYRKTLARLLCSYMPVVTPSSFLVDSEGHYIPDEIIEMAPDRREAELVRRQVSGLCAEEQFAPLPQSLREKNPKVTKQLASRYTKYRKQVVLPFASALKTCNELVFLIDVAAVLESGVGFLNAHRTLLEQILAYIQPGMSPGRAAARWLRWAATLGFAPLSHVERVTFVASKADRVHIQDRIKLEGLLRQLASPLIKPFKAVRNLKDGYLVCAAVQACNSDPDNDRTVYFKQQNAEGKEFVTKRVNVPDVPEIWPDDYASGHYKFPQADVWIPRAKTNPPPQFGLHRIAELILS